MTATGGHDIHYSGSLWIMILFNSGPGQDHLIINFVLQWITVVIIVIC